MKRYVVVTTDKDRHGVFFGILSSYDPDKQYAILKNARMCIYWPAANKGVVGLAAIGPVDGSRITPSIPSIEVNGVTAVMDCTPEAVKEWEIGKWTS